MSEAARTAETPVVSTVHHPFGNPAGPGLWHHKNLQLPSYIQNVAHAFRRKGLSESEAIERAVGVVRDWASGRAPNGGHVHPDVQAAASKAIAEWEAAKASTNHGERFNPYHLGAGPGGGEFTSAGGGGGGGKSSSTKAKSHPSATVPGGGHAPHGHGQHARKERLLARAHEDRQRARQLEVQLHALEKQLTASAAASKKAAASAHSAKKAGHKVSSHRHHKAAHHHARHSHHLRSRIASLRHEIRTLLTQAASLEKQARGLRSLAVVTEFQNSEGSAGMALDTRAQMATQDINDLPDSAFAYIEPGGTKDASGKTMPRGKRHFPVHDKAHADNAAARIAQGAKFGKEALPKVQAAQKKYGESPAGRSVLADEEVRELRITSQYKDLDSRLELRMDDAGGQWIGGYASVFMPRESRNLGGFIERVAPSAFSDAKAAGWQDVVCRFNHDSNYVLGTTAADTLRLRTDGVGLDYQVLPPVAEERIRELVERGDIRYSSFAFRVRPNGDEWGVTDQNFPMRTLHDVELVDVAPVLTPAYPDATAAVRATAPALRSLANQMQIAVDEVRALAEADELRRLFVRTDRPIYRPEPKKLFGPAAAAMLLQRREDPYS